MTARSAVALSLVAIALTVMAGCATEVAGTAGAGATLASASASAGTNVPPTVAPPVTVTATLAPPSTVTATPPPVVVLPQPPVTVTQVPLTVYPYEPGGGNSAPSSNADQQVASDSYTAELTIGWWIPQLSSNPDSASAMAKFSSLRGMTGNYSDVFMVSSNNFTSFRHSGYFVIMIPRIFSTAAAANGWCDSEGFAAENCFAKRLSHIYGPDGNSVERG